MFVLSFQFAILQTFGRGLSWPCAVLAKYMIVFGYAEHFYERLFLDQTNFKEMRSAEILAQLNRVTFDDVKLVRLGANILSIMCA